MGNSMTPFEVYKTYLSIKTHFTKPKYNALESLGSVNVPFENFDGRQDKIVFETISRRYKTDREVRQFFIANFAYGNTYVVHSSESHRNYVEWMKRKESITQVVSNDLTNMSYMLEDEGTNEPLVIRSGMPPLLKYFLGNNVTYETMVILQDMYHYLELWKDNVLLWQDIFLRIHKGKSFVTYERDRLVKVIEKSDICFTKP